MAPPSVLLCFMPALNQVTSVAQGGSIDEAVLEKVRSATVYSHLTVARIHPVCEW